LGVLVGGRGVFVGRGGAVLVGAAGVSVAGIGVSVGTSSVGAGVSVGCGVSVGRDVSVGGIAVSVGTGVSLGTGLGVGVKVLVNRGRWVLVGVAVTRADSCDPSEQPSSAPRSRVATAAKIRIRFLIERLSPGCSLDFWHKPGVQHLVASVPARCWLFYPSLEAMSTTCEWLGIMVHPHRLELDMARFL
jgi:hypothetical protein